jgi:hypothetical protein
VTAFNKQKEKKLRMKKVASVVLVSMRDAEKCKNQKTENPKDRKRISLLFLQVPQLTLIQYGKQTYFTTLAIYFNAVPLSCQADKSIRLKIDSRYHIDLYMAPKVTQYFSQSHTLLLTIF